MMIKISYSSLLLSAIFVGFVIYSNCQQPDLCRKKNKQNGGLFEHEEYCDYYWRCDSRKSEPYLQACPNGLAFAGKGRGLFEFCGYPHLLKTCDGEVRYQAQEPVSSENCPYAYGIFPHKTSCAKYWQCWNGTASEQKCGFQLLYNEEISSCDYPSNVKGCQKHPVCKEVPNGPVLLKGSCILYWQCVGGYPRLERCPAGLAVNPRTLKCELATTVPECAPKVTTPKPEDPDEEEDEKSNEKNDGKNEEKKKGTPIRLNSVAKAAKEPKVAKESKDQNDPKVQDPKVIIIIKAPPKPKPKPKRTSKPKVVKAQREITASSSSLKHQKEVRKEAKIPKEAQQPKETKKEKKEVKASNAAKPASKPSNAAANKASSPAKSSNKPKANPAKASSSPKAASPQKASSKASNQPKASSEAREKKKKRKQKQGTRSH